MPVLHFLFQQKSTDQLHDDNGTEAINYSDHNSRSTPESQDGNQREEGSVDDRSNSSSHQLRNNKTVGSDCSNSNSSPNRHGNHYSRWSDDSRDNGSLHQHEASKKLMHQAKIMSNAHPNLQPSIKLEPLDLDAITGSGLCTNIEHGGGILYEHVNVGPRVGSHVPSTQMLHTNRPDINVPSQAGSVQNLITNLDSSSLIQVSKQNLISSIVPAEQFAQTDAPINLSLSSTRSRELPPQHEHLGEITTHLPEHPQRSSPLPKNREGSSSNSDFVTTQINTPIKPNPSADDDSCSPARIPDQMPSQSQYRAIPGVEQEQPSPCLSQSAQSFSQSQLRAFPEQNSENPSPSPTCAQPIKEYDEASVFGKLVELEWRKISGARARHVVKMKIQELLFEAQNERLSVNPCESPSSNDTGNPARPICHSTTHSWCMHYE